MTTDPTGPLAEFICNLKYADLPERVRTRVYLITVDAIANAFAGWHANETKSIAGLAVSLGGRGSSSVIGGEPLSLAGASVLNAYLITAVSACDVYRPALCHVTPEVIPPALAMAERNGASGEQLLLAIAVGLETTVRLGHGLHYSVFRSKGWHSPGVIGPFGGAAAVGKLLGLDVDQLRHALGLAGSQAAGTFAAFGTAAVKFHQSHGALAGLMAGLAAGEGFKTTDKILTHSDGGLFNVMSDGGDPEVVTRNLGEHWELENISLRLWPAAASLQSVISGLIALIQQHDVKPKDVRHVQIGLPKAAYEMNGTMGWQNRLSAMLSARYVTSVVLHDRMCWLDQFDAAHLANQAILDFASSRIQVEIDETVGADGAAIAIDTLTGEKFTQRRSYPKGDPRDPLTQSQIFNKLRVFGESRLESARVSHVAALLENLTTLANVQALGVALARKNLEDKC